MSDAIAGHGGSIKVFLGKIIHCSEPFKVHTLENGFMLVVGNKVSYTFFLTVDIKKCAFLRTKAIPRHETYI